MRLFLVLLAVTPWGCTANTDVRDTHPKERVLLDQVGRTVTLTGIAESRKNGPALVTQDGVVWMEALKGSDGRAVSDWPTNLTGKRVRATGTLVRRGDLPVLSREQSRSDPTLQGIPSDWPEGSRELKEARQRFLLQNVAFEVAP